MAASDWRGFRSKSGSAGISKLKILNSCNMQTKNENEIYKLLSSIPTQPNDETIDLGLQCKEILGKKHYNRRFQRFNIKYQ